MPDPVLCPVAPELVRLLKKPGGMINRGPTKMWLDEDNVLNVMAISDAEAERCDGEATARIDGWDRDPRNPDAECYRDLGAEQDDGTGASDAV